MKPVPLTLIALLLVLAGCQNTSAEEPNTKAGDQSQPKRVTRPEAIDIVAAIGKVEPEREIFFLAANANGVVKELYKQDGEQVNAGDPLVQLEDDIERLQTEEIRKRIATQKTQVELDRTAIRETETRLAAKRRDLAATSRLAETGAARSREVDDLNTEIELLKVELETRKLTVRRSTDQLAELQQQLLLYETQAAKKTLRAPADGIVLDLLVHPGSALNLFADYAEFAPEGKTVIRAEVDELFANRIEAGMPVEIRYVGNVDPIADGQVTRLSPYLKKKSLFSDTPGEREDRLVRAIEIELNGQPSLLLNTKVECIIRIND